MVVHKYEINESIEKAKKPVQVTRNGKTFIQMREVGKKEVGETEEQIEEQMREVGKKEVGETEEQIEEQMRDMEENEAPIEYDIDPVDKESIFEYLRNHDVAPGEADSGMIDEIVEDDDIRITMEQQQQIIDEYNSQPKKDTRSDFEKLANRADSLEMGVRGLAANIEGEMQKAKAEYDSATDDIGRTRAYNYEMGLKRSIDLLNDGLKHLIDEKPKEKFVPHFKRNLGLGR